ncbi:unnamed protein product [marine sediment metagenome]|uniref:Uncharacterized protein n=1 Tax=marine sediment metagenome TaxID=412755 RepID=X0SZE9_9ZZZZ
MSDATLPALIERARALRVWGYETLTIPALLDVAAAAECPDGSVDGTECPKMNRDPKGWCPTCQALARLREALQREVT